MSERINDFAGPDATAEEVLRIARARESARAAAHVPIDYAGVRNVQPKLKAMLTRAVKSGDSAKVLMACRAAVRAWDAAPYNGAWPDNWSNWQRALDDSLGYMRSVRLEDLS
jgi:hypothetical protein